MVLIYTFTILMKDVKKIKVCIIGGGASSLLLGALLDSSKFEISIFEKNAALGRKFLVAGDGGFNLTHSEETSEFINRYHPSKFIASSIKKFSNEDFRNYLKGIGIETYVGSSKRVFPSKEIKPIQVLNAFENELKKNNVQLFFKHTWKGFDKEGNLLFENNGTEKTIHSNITIFSLGGASWKVTGSDGTWLNYFKEKGIHTIDFEASNCGFKIEHKKHSKTFFGSALKNCVFTCGDATKKGEAVLTAFGIEGSGIYPLSKEIRKQLQKKKKAILHIDLKPDLTEAEIKTRIENKGDYSIKDVLSKKINLSDAQVELIKTYTTKEEYTDASALSKLIKNFSVEITGSAPIDEAISTVGGIDLKEITTHFELKKLPQHYCIGEMLNWDAPTGGYLLQACFSMAHHLATHLNKQHE